MLCDALEAGDQGRDCAAEEDDEGPGGDALEREREEEDEVAREDL